MCNLRICNVLWNRPTEVHHFALYQFPITRKPSQFVIFIFSLMIQLAWSLAILSVFLKQSVSWLIHLCIDQSIRLICRYLILMYLSNVTRFGEISPLWQHFNRLWENFDMVLIWYLVNFWTYFENFYANVSNFNYINGQILKNHIAIWSHCICTFVSIRRRRIDLFNSHLLVDDAAEVLTWRGAQDSQDVVKLIQVVLAGKDRSVRQHFSQDATHGPDIDGLCVALK